MSKETLTAVLTTVTLAASVLSTSVLADEKPWDRDKPANMTEAHLNQAIDAWELQQVLPPADFGEDPREMNWEDKNGFLYGIPLSNMSVPQLNSLITDRYYVFRDVRGGAWGARYHSSDGKTYFCEYNRNREEYVEWVYNRHVATTLVGMAGITYYHPKSPAKEGSHVYGEPVIGNPETGALHMYWWDGQKWAYEPGWVQDNIADVFVENCPGMPRSTEINNKQTSFRASDLAKDARFIRGFGTQFRNSPDDPLTGEMYYWYVGNNVDVENY